MDDRVYISRLSHVIASREKRDSPRGVVVEVRGATVFAREVGSNPSVHSDKTYNLELNIRSDV